ncbi:4-(cytidine 5'-diphospho)-2-C-methyl-D-erythritol kinase [Nitrospira lenta]|uniref:4-diphosphocytidyl-2-C-methyl-D-erythritol kinase n=1 Tax=Nitrospira lenta TaxID=1436998 RepID=A0A330L9K1_9BACT|nr:4-(cytidine 5'-diphospho)-2-C-methyl-D-erythritol kinase [Nitrospira lenta]SPP63596.1 4-diphosphocytidyl-2-C-methyl-D-erythritol kinase [Nitrospira lenta]
MTRPHEDSPDPSRSAVTVFAPAKVNLILRVLDRRPEGFHNLWSLMQTVGLEDAVTIRSAPQHTEIRLQCDSNALSVDQTNLVYRAAAAVLAQAQRKIGLDIRLAKRIPMGAGLGGGSSDAAATILGINQLLKLGWSAAQMAEVGQELGSDVPFFFHAPTAVVAGRGERVKAIHVADSRWVVLVNPGFPVETKWAYQQLSTTRQGVVPLSERCTQLEAQPLTTWDAVISLASNDFEGPVFAAHPILQQIKRGLLSGGAQLALLSGSGATVFGIFQEEAEARQSAATFHGRSEMKAFVVQTNSGKLRIE